ncbi:methionyl-tRNA formyltransferase [Paenibacillus agricola]|uniref:Formyl transferase n=1 Tax=Paenibacillus agricola TaxID=2716264 RepID=A0ABX0J0N8_9BACL|nr:formyltransferase family protein [Paenibacillus agricola]NHN29391.1 formyl transferase [Paenibacillus agricola]
MWIADKRLHAEDEENGKRTGGKWKLVLFGSLGVAVDCLRWLLTEDSFEVLGVVCTRKPRSAWRLELDDPDMQEAAIEWGIPLLTMDDVLSMEADFGLSVRFHEILRPQHLARFRLGVVNLHGAPLPDMRGSMCDAAAIVEGRSEFGTSLHWMDKGVDTGPILAVRRFPIAEEDTVFELFQQSNELGLELIKETLVYIATGRLRGVPQQEYMDKLGITATTYYADQVLKYKQLPAGLSKEETSRRIRAFQFPGHEPVRIGRKSNG